MSPVHLKFSFCVVIVTVQLCHVWKTQIGRINLQRSIYCCTSIVPWAHCPNILYMIYITCKAFIVCAVTCPNSKLLDFIITSIEWDQVFVWCFQSSRNTRVDVYIRSSRDGRGFWHEHYYERHKSDKSEWFILQFFYQIL